MRQIDFIKKYSIFVLNRNNRRDPNIWVFGEWFGRRCGDNATYLANYISRHYNAIEVYWFCHKNCDTSILDSKIKVIDFSTEEAVAISKKAGVAFVVEGIIDLNDKNYNYWGNAVKVNLWHGVPWKKIGNDMFTVENKSISDYFKDRTYRFDLFQSPSEEYTNHLLTGFNTKRETIVNAGLPRNTVFFDASIINGCRSHLLRMLTLSTNIRIACYLPTFRDSHTRPFSFTEISDPSFYKWLEDNNIYIIQKAHAAETGSFSGSSEQIINISDISAQELMAASDMLITDYSSCFFDYLLLDRPIIHYLYDYDYYKNKDRGLYYEKEEVVCGAAPETENELIKAIKENFENPSLYHDLRMEQKAKFLTYESADSCEIITQRIFEELRKRRMQIK